ncbi:MAG: DUF421 domain-containing protein [Clostridia bacterium]|nr:DUF421 domain-containing protein [Clostridia bacterium]
MEFINIILTALLSVCALFIITKIMGHKQVAQLDFFDYVSGITIGSIGAELATELEKPYKPLIALVVYGIVSLILNLLAHKIPRTRKYINGTPTILFDSNKIYRSNLKKAKIDLSEFMLMCREQGYFFLDEIQTIVLEHNGKLSILPKSSNRPATPQDLNIPVNPTRMDIEVIMDGRILDENLLRMGKNARWLEKQIKVQGFKNPGEIFLGIFRKEDESLALYRGE